MIGGSTVASVAITLAAFGLPSPPDAPSTIREVDAVRQAPTLAAPMKLPWSVTYVSYYADAWPDGEANLRGIDARKATRVLGVVNHRSVKGVSPGNGALHWCATKDTTPNYCSNPAWTPIGRIVFDGVVGGVRVRASADGSCPDPPNSARDWTRDPNRAP